MNTIYPEYSMQACCSALQLSKRGFNAWQAKQKHCAENKLEDDLKEWFDKHKSRAGAPKLVKDMNALGYRISARTISRRMVDLGLRAQHPKPFKATTDSNHNLMKVIHCQIGTIFSIFAQVLAMILSHVNIKFSLRMANQVPCIGKTVSAKPM